MERDELSRTFGILMAGLLRAEHQLGKRHAASGVYKIDTHGQAPRQKPRPSATPSSAPPDSSRR